MSIKEAHYLDKLLSGMLIYMVVSFILFKDELKSEMFHALVLAFALFLNDFMGVAWWSEHQTRRQEFRSSNSGSDTVSLWPWSCHLGCIYNGKIGTCNSRLEELYCSLIATGLTLVCVIASPLLPLMRDVSDFCYYKQGCRPCFSEVLSIHSSM